jgi:hypothetical protein
MMAAQAMKATRRAVRCMGRILPDSLSSNVI